VNICEPKPKFDFMIVIYLKRYSL